MEQLEFTATENEAGVRIDRCLSDKYEELSRSYLQKLLKEQGVTVNGKAVKANYKIQAGDLVQTTLPDLTEPDILPENIPLDILYEDDDVLVINKPKGMVVHPANGHTSGTLVNAIMYHCQGNLSGINGVMRPGIVHRIDKDTTGALLVCKNDTAHRDLAQQLKAHTIKRRYRAIVAGNLKEDEGTVEGPIGRHPIDRKKMAINYKNGKDAVTHYKVLERFGNATYIECRLETGRTHQIRVHMTSLGHPLLGDEIYGSGKNPYHLQAPKLAAISSAGVIVTNLSLDLLFMKVLNWGLVGASASLCIAETVGTLILLTHFWNKQALLSFHFHIPTWNEIKEYVENGFGVGSAFIFQAVVMLVFNTMLLKENSENGTFSVAVFGVIYTMSTIPARWYNQGVLGGMTGELYDSFQSGKWFWTL